MSVALQSRAEYCEHYLATKRSSVTLRSRVDYCECYLAIEGTSYEAEVLGMLEEPLTEDAFLAIVPYVDHL